LDVRRLGGEVAGERREEDQQGWPQKGARGAKTEEEAHEIK
jgi:hypothetical protein